MRLRIITITSFLAAAFTSIADGKTIRVPAEVPTIQAAIDSATDGDTVLVAPGTYHEALRIAGKSIVLASEFIHSKDERHIEDTVLTGTTTDADGGKTVLDAILVIESSASPNTEIIGFTIRDGDDGISCQADVRIAHNRFFGNEDAVDYEGGGGLCEHNHFEGNADDAVDYDLDCDAKVIHNTMVDNLDDGIEIRLHDYRGKTLELVIRDNVITGNGEDGIQIIDYPGMSDRRIRIERNLIARNKMAGVGCMSDGITVEDYRAADIPEPLEIINNTIAENEHGIAGGDNVVAFNNVIIENRRLGLKRVDGDSVLRDNLVWKNGSGNDAASNIAETETRTIDPLLNADFQPTTGSPCIGAGVASCPGPDGTVSITPLSGETISNPHLGSQSPAAD